MKLRTLNTTDLSNLHKLLYAAHSLYDTLDFYTNNKILTPTLSIENTPNDEITINNCKEKLKLIKQEIINLLSC